nr:receptor-like protein kinase THESEUS 1 [Ipomoea batatas]
MSGSGLIGSTGYGHDEAGGREALDLAFAEIFVLLRYSCYHLCFVCFPKARG